MQTDKEERDMEWEKGGEDDTVPCVPLFRVSDIPIYYIIGCILVDEQDADCSFVRKFSFDDGEWIHFYFFMELALYSRVKIELCTVVIFEENDDCFLYLQQANIFIEFHAYLFCILL